MELSKEELKVEQEALAFAKSNKKKIARRRTDKTLYLAEEEPVSVFMAGSPGAGKTEASLELIEQLVDGGSRVLRIDPDELRDEFATYTGINSYLFQPAVSILVEKLHDFALQQRQSFLLDGTLANYEKAVENIQRSLNKGRLVQILYVYQDPHLAWQFVKAREQQEGRRIPVKEFVDQYFAARDTVNRLKRRFGRELKIDLLLKEIDNSHRAYEANIGKIDNHVPEKYTPPALEQGLDS